MPASDTARLIAELTLRDKMSAGLRTASASLGRFESSVGRVGTGAGQLAGGFARLGIVAAGAVAGGLGYAASKAIDFEDAFAGVRKTVDEADLAKAGLSFEALATSFRKMATEIPIAATEFAAIGETAGALGIAAGDIETFTRTVALLGVTTNLTSAEAAESLGKIGTILGLTGKDYTTFADALVNLGNKGASTEAEIIEITKRFGAAGKQAGLSTDQILGFSSAIASAGVEPEAAGSSLSRLFNNLIKETALASEKGKEFADVTGLAFKDFSGIVKNDTNQAMLLFLDSLRKLDKFEQIKALKGVGITNVRDINAIQLLASTYDENLIPALENAKDSVGALSVEATKRFDTLRSKLTLLKQNFIEGALIIGEGFTPAIGRATDKLIAFLKVDSNKAALRTLGEDIGRAIDSIDFQKILSGGKDFAGIMRNDVLPILRTAFDLFNSLPDPVKGIGAAFAVGLNTPIVGGAVSQIGKGMANVFLGAVGIGLKGLSGVLGAAGKAGGALGGVSKLLAQPVFVTNWPVGGLGGVGGAAGKPSSGKLGILGALFGAAGILTLGYAIGEAVHDAFPEQTSGNQYSDSARQAHGQGTSFPASSMTKDRTPGTSGGLSPDERDEKAVADFKAAVEQFGAHTDAVKGFGSTELTAFRTTAEGAIGLFDERIKYLAGAQGSGAGTEKYLALVQRDIDALKTIIPTASASDAAAITAQIAVLQGILDAKKFAPTQELLDAIKNPNPPGLSPDAKDAANRQIDASRATAEAIKNKAWTPKITVNTSVNVSTSVTVRDQQRKTRSAVSTGTSYGIS